MNSCLRSSNMKYLCNDDAGTHSSPKEIVTQTLNNHLDANALAVLAPRAEALFVIWSPQSSFNLQISRRPSTISASLRINIAPQRNCTETRPHLVSTHLDGHIVRHIEGSRQVLQLQHHFGG